MLATDRSLERRKICRNDSTDDAEMTHRQAVNSRSMPPKQEMLDYRQQIVWKTVGCNKTVNSGRVA